MSRPVNYTVSFRFMASNVCIETKIIKMDSRQTVITDSIPAPATRGRRRGFFPHLGRFLHKDTAQMLFIFV